MTAKQRMTLEDDRIPWDYLKNNFPKWREAGAWIRGVFRYDDMGYKGTTFFSPAMYRELLKP